MVTLHQELADHTWKEITNNGLFTTHNPKGDCLYGTDISTHPKHRHEGIGSILYGVRKQLAIRIGLKRSDWHLQIIQLL